MTIDTNKNKPGISKAGRADENFEGRDDENGSPENNDD